MTAIVILRWLFVATLVGVSLRLAPTAWRALSKPRVKDFDYLLFFGLALNRLLFIGKSLAYPNPPASTGEAAWTIVGYLTGIALELGVVTSH